MGDDGFRLTVKLRWLCASDAEVGSWDGPRPLMFGARNGNFYKLQQEWVSSDFVHEWRDVPEEY